jgi:hypothetical protein
MTVQLLGILKKHGTQQKSDIEIILVGLKNYIHINKKERKTGPWF